MQRLFSLLLICIITISAGAVSFGKIYTSVSAFATTNNADETERFEQTYSFNSNGRIEVGNINGSITVEAWDNPQIKLEYTKIADDRERLNDVEVKIEAGKDSFRVKTDYVKQKDGVNWNRGKLYVEFRLSVPRTAVLDKISSVNGSINISDMSDSVRATAVNGNILAKNLSGALHISTVNGTLNAELTQMKTGSDVNLSTVNGTVNLYLPSYVDAVFSGSTVNGSINTDLGLTVTKRKYGPGSSLSGTLGSGSSQVKLSSVNGTIAVKQGSATNL
jgi:DUF4097 and DUF4098 domain-containing protein YvlB